jgi:hypothetical protein
VTDRNMGSTQRLFEVLEKNRGKLFTAGQLANLAGVTTGSVGKLLNQVKSRTPDLRLESPSRGLWVYRGWSTDPITEIPTSVATDLVGLSTPPPSPSPTIDSSTKDLTPIHPGRPRRRATEPTVAVGDVCEVIGLSQGGTPIVRDGNGRLYQLQQF